MGAAVRALQPIHGLRVDVVALGVLVEHEVVIATDQRPACQHGGLPAAHAARSCDRRTALLVLAELGSVRAPEDCGAHAAPVDLPRARRRPVSRPAHVAARAHWPAAHQKRSPCSTATAGSAAAWNTSAGTAARRCSTS